MDAKLIKNFICWSLWLLLLIIWNFVYPEANPLEDVLAGVVLAICLNIFQKASQK